MIRYAITNRALLGGSLDRLLASIEQNDRDGVDYIQIREKDLDAGPLSALVSEAVALCRRSKILVNTRADLAIACGAAGVHLASHAPAPAVWRRIAPPGFLIGVSCHSVEEVVQAENEGADSVLFAPIFAPLSKPPERAPQGLDRLSEAASRVRIPVYALGGITKENAPLCIAAGAAGVAGITLFQTSL